MLNFKIFWNIISAFFIKKKIIKITVSHLEWNGIGPVLWDLKREMWNLLLFFWSFYSIKKPEQIV